MQRSWAFGLALMLMVFTADAGFSAYHHMGEKDSDVFRLAYPDKVGTKLDSCTLCHSGGEVEQKGKMVNLGSCQWCHLKYGYDASGDISQTLNPYGKAFLDAGRDTAALAAIANIDSDGDTYSNENEILATRFPGDPEDDPTKVTAPFKVFSREDLERMDQHTQFLLMNAHKSTDHYAEYTGVTMESLLKSAKMLPSATGIKVYAPDGFSQYHPLHDDPDPLMYPVFGDYPEALYYYDAEAAFSELNPLGWCEYTAPSCAGRNHGDLITNENGLKMILAIKRDGEYLTPGVLTVDNKLDGEGPFRVVPPQKVPGPPDQRSTAADQNVVWPFDEPADHNAGFSTRSATIIRVEPLPEGTTDIDTLEAGWEFVDNSKIVVYGAIDPTANAREKMDELFTSVSSMDKAAFRRPFYKRYFEYQVKAAQRYVDRGRTSIALRMLENHLLRRTDGCIKADRADRYDCVKDCEAQKQLYWSINEIITLLKAK